MGGRGRRPGRQAKGEGERRGGIYGAHAGVQNTPRLKLETKTPVGAKLEIFTLSHPTAEVLSSSRSLLRDAAISMKIRFVVLWGPRNPGRCLVLRKPPKLHAREDSHLHAVALDAVHASAF